MYRILAKDLAADSNSNGNLNNNFLSSFNFYTSCPTVRPKNTANQEDKKPSANDLASQLILELQGGETIEPHLKRQLLKLLHPQEPSSETVERNPTVVQDKKTMVKEAFEIYMRSQLTKPEKSFYEKHGLSADDQDAATIAMQLINEQLNQSGIMSLAKMLGFIGGMDSRTGFSAQLFRADEITNPALSAAFIELQLALAKRLLSEVATPQNKNAFETIFMRIIPKGTEIMWRIKDKPLQHKKLIMIDEIRKLLS
ncbi:MAG: hypothetical protein ABIE74_09925 [Pseudomonadota bacterium]